MKALQIFSSFFIFIFLCQSIHAQDNHERVIITNDKTLEHIVFERVLVQKKMYFKFTNRNGDMELLQPSKSYSFQEMKTLLEKVSSDQSTRHTTLLTSAGVTGVFTFASVIMTIFTGGMRKITAFLLTLLGIELAIEYNPKSSYYKEEEQKKDLLKVLNAIYEEDEMGDIITISSPNFVQFKKSIFALEKSAN